LNSDFWLHLKREKQRVLWISDFREFFVLCELVGGADQLSKGQRLVHDVPTKAGRRHAPTLDKRNETATKRLKKNQNYLFLKIFDKRSLL
jgi:hypothetical protein